MAIGIVGSRLVAGMPEADVPNQAATRRFSFVDANLQAVPEPFATRHLVKGPGRTSL
jgi:hypothetical protein